MKENFKFIINPPGIVDGLLIARWL